MALFCTPLPSGAVPVCDMVILTGVLVRYSPMSSIVPLNSSVSPVTYTSVPASMLKSATTGTMSGTSGPVTSKAAVARWSPYSTAMEYVPCTGFPVRYTLVTKLPSAKTSLSLDVTSPLGSVMLYKNGSSGITVTVWADTMIVSPSTYCDISVHTLRWDCEESVCAYAAVPSRIRKGMTYRLLTIIGFLYHTYHFRIELGKIELVVKVIHLHGIVAVSRNHVASCSGCQSWISASIHCGFFALIASAPF